MTYDRHAGAGTPAVPHTSPNVDRVMAQGTQPSDGTHEDTVDRLLSLVERLTGGLASTQAALHDLTLEIARAGLGDHAGAPRDGVRASRSPAAPAAPAAPTTPASAIPPRRSDHAVLQEPSDAYPGFGTPARAPDGSAPAAPAGQDGHAQPRADELAPPAPSVQLVGAQTAAAAALPAAEQLAPTGAAQLARPDAAQPDAAPPTAAPAPVQQQLQPRSPAAASQAAAAAVAARQVFQEGNDRSGRHAVASLTHVPLLSAGAVDVMLGPIRDLGDLDALRQRMVSMSGVLGATVMAFEGQDVLVRIDVDRPLPLASMLRGELGRPVESCRLVEGRIVVTFERAEGDA